jgi:AcrR family transcriptional regulator
MARPQKISDQQIDEAARAVFIEHGAAAPVSRIAAELGVSHAALLQRAGSKENLIRRALGPGVPEFLEHLAQRPPAHGAAAALEQLLMRLLAFHESMLPGLIVLRTSGHAMPPSDEMPPTISLRRQLAAWLGRTGAVTSKPRTRALAEALLGALEARCFNAYLGGPHFISGTNEAFIHELVTFLIPELAPKKRSRRHP